eukprot:CAMPEP_0175854616 /NCGR_PEP_ID=MMETSP0107_2-20121207/27460_1 /TAXON_ID=195067 ORGANISM="Goniomonas pacifica, Strain CCMP1869" /NCGR_SAMPLE_ID=MMETSP0107_2 /ASSEMBLY_ACC=CAM_ASM_000203 /LENGTH=77 /DNA_ID=CAMNT_0017170467 /DNA_START=33 /DNA_END=264 /DNA_ORIENTATION=-
MHPVTGKAARLAPAEATTVDDEAICFHWGGCDEASSVGSGWVVLVGAVKHLCPFALRKVQTKCVGKPTFCKSVAHEE